MKKVSEITKLIVGKGFYDTRRLQAEFKVSKNAANSTIYNIRNSGKYHHEEKRVNGLIAVRLIEIKEVYTTHKRPAMPNEKRTAQLWDLALFGKVPA